MDEFRTITRIGLMLLLYYVVYAVFMGITNPVPALGDSWDYHIPIARTILDGRFLHLTNAKLPQWYYPGSSEAFHALFLFLGIPLTLSNLLASVVLFFSLWKLGRVFRLGYYEALFFALTFLSLNVIVRWFNAVSIDVWMAVFFCWGIILLEQPKKTLQYSLALGFVSGMLIGSKYTAIVILLSLYAIYFRSLRTLLHPLRVLAFLIPFSVFGLFWYFRNYFLLGNPVYPLSLLWFKGTDLFTLSVLTVTLNRPIQMFHALFSEYKLWSLTLLLPFVYGIAALREKKIRDTAMTKLFLLGVINALFYLQYPTSYEEPIMVSSFRYSFPFFICLILGAFLLAKKYNKMNLLGYFAIGNMIMVTSFAYAPKLVIIYLPLAFLCYYLIDRCAPASTKNTIPSPHRTVSKKERNPEKK